VRWYVTPQIALLCMSLYVIAAFRSVLETELCVRLQNTACNVKVQIALATEISISYEIIFCQYINM
jgi:hypothetical protein